MLTSAEWGAVAVVLAVAELSTLPLLVRRGFLLENQNGAGLADDAEDGLEALPPVRAVINRSSRLVAGEPLLPH